MCFSVEKALRNYNEVFADSNCKEHYNSKEKYICIEEKCTAFIFCDQCKPIHPHQSKIYNLKMVNVVHLLQSFRTALDIQSHTPQKYSVLQDLRNQFFFALKTFSEKKDLKLFVNLYFHHSDS